VTIFSGHIHIDIYTYVYTYTYVFRHIYNVYIQLEMHPSRAVRRLLLVFMNTNNGCHTYKHIHVNIYTHVCAYTYLRFNIYMKYIYIQLEMNPSRAVRRPLLVLTSDGTFNSFEFDNRVKLVHAGIGVHVYS